MRRLENTKKGKKGKQNKLKIAELNTDQANPDRNAKKYCIKNLYFLISTVA